MSGHVPIGHVGGPVYGRGDVRQVFAVAVIGVQGHLIGWRPTWDGVSRRSPYSGLPGTGVQDGRERVRPAVESAGLEWPLRRVVVNLSPANLRKDGPGFDLPIAMGVLTASAQVPSSRLAEYAFAGELSLRGELVSTPGILAVAISAARAGLRGVVVPAANVSEAGLVEGSHVVPAATLAEVVAVRPGTWVPPALVEPQPLPSSGSAAGAGSGGDPGPGAGPAGVGGGGRRRPQSVDGRPAGGGEDHARQAAPHHLPGHVEG